MNRFFWPSLLFCIYLSSGLALEVKETQLEKVLADPIVKPHYQKCVSQGKTADKLSACIWAELGKSPSDQKQIVEKYFNSEKTAKKYDSLEQKTISSGENPAIKKLEDFMSKKLEEALYGEYKERKKNAAIADHAVFYSLYKNQISKNIITSISSYCLEAGSSNGLPIISSDEGKRQVQRKSNMEQLQSFAPAEDGEKANEAYAQWGQCLSQISAVCAITPGDDEDREDKVYSKGRACVLSNYLKQLRQGLIAADAIDQQIKDTTNTDGFSARNVRVYTGKGDDETASINELTSISSNEFVNKSGYSDTLASQKAEVDQCIESQDMEKCKKFLDDPAKKKELEDAIAEYDLKKRMMKSKLEKMDAEQIKDYLKEEGRTDEEIERVLASDETIESVRQEINRNFDNERQAIINQMKTKVNERTIASDSKGFETELPKLEKIRQELAQQGESYKQLIHYNNIVSGFLSVTDSSGKTVGTNVQSIQREMADSAYDKNNAGARQPASSDQGSSDDDYFSKLTKKLNEMVETDGDKGKDSKQDATPIGTDSLNQHLFKYKSIPEKKENEE